MPEGIVSARVSAEPLDPDALLRAVDDAHYGAVVSFLGVVRDHDHGRTVTALHYEAHPSAAEVIREIAEQAAAEHPDAGIAIEHRTGDLGIGDVALVCVVGAAHRAEAFALCADTVDEVKRRLPIWKRQGFADGDEEWVGSLT